MLSYNNDPEFKKACVLSAKRHAELDMLRSGTYGEMNGSFHGCSVGCDAFDITHQVKTDNPHQITAKYFGFPEWLEHLRDTIFEGLPEKERVKWHVRLKQSVPAGLTEEQFETVKAKFLIYLLDGNLATVRKLKISKELKIQVVDAIKQCKAVWRDYLKTRSFDKEAARSAERSAASVAWSAESAAWSAERSAASAAWSAESSVAWSAESAAWSAERSAESVASVAWSAARSAARSAAWSAERSAAYKKYATKIIELLKAA